MNLTVLWRFCHSGVHDMKLPMSRRFDGSGVEEVRLSGSLATVCLVWKKRDSLGLSDFVIVVWKWNYRRHEYLTFWCRWSETDRVTATLPVLMWRTWEDKSHCSFAILVCRKWDNLNDDNLKILTWRKRIFQSHGGVPYWFGESETSYPNWRMRIHEDASVLKETRNFRGQTPFKKLWNSDNTVNKETAIT